MQWKPEQGSVVARTAFAELHTWRVLSWSYAARVYALDLRLLAQHADLPTDEAAKCWAEQTYAELLRAELAALRAAQPSTAPDGAA